MPWGVHQNNSGTSHKTSFGEYTNNSLHVTGQGTIINHPTIINNETTNHQPRSTDPLAELKKRNSLSAAFDSGERFDPPRCTESTRLGILRKIKKWIDSDNCDRSVPASLFWLYGGAGVGKSAVAQSISEKYQAKKGLAASFFFFRSDETRNNGEYLIPTLVCQLVNAFNGLDGFVREAIQTNPDIFTKQYQSQMHELLVRPLRGLNSQNAPSFFNPRSVFSIVSTGSQRAWPRLIVIDGLDECQDPDIQCKLLRVLARAIPNIPYPIRFFITSRPESHISRVFDYDQDLQAGITVHRYNLSEDPDADMDVQKFFEAEFKEIRRVHPLARYLPPDWPGEDAIDRLVERSSGHFIYASTVIRYIRSPKHRPDDRLEVILRLLPPINEQDRPYAQLDALYGLIFQGVEGPGQLEEICLVLGILYFKSRNIGFFSSRASFGNKEIEEILDLKAGDLILILDPLLSLVAIDHDGRVRTLHKSLFDYTLDRSRSRQLPFDLSRVHEVVATYLLKQTNMADQNWLIENSQILDFVYHCQFGYLNNTLKICFYSLEVPYIGASPRAWNIESISRLLCHFFDILTHKDFDTTGHYYKQYARKWASYLNSFIEVHPPPPIYSSRQFIRIKDHLDKMLIGWKPQNGDLRDVPSKNFRRVDFIKQEHSIFETLMEAKATSEKSVNAFSSLVFGKHFAHSYHFRFRGDSLCEKHEVIFLMLITYTRHNNRSFLRTYKGDILRAMQTFLEDANKLLCSDFYQTYGIEPEDMLKKDDSSEDTK